MCVHNRPLAGTGLLGGWAAVLVLVCTLLPACESRLNWFHENGQIMVVPGQQSDHGDREGVWCYFNADGSILLTKTNEYGVMDRTGYYEHGKRVRELSRSELDSSIRQAEELMREYRSNSRK